MYMHKMQEGYIIDEGKSAGDTREGFQNGTTFTLSLKRINSFPTE